MASRFDTASLYGQVHGTPNGGVAGLIRHLADETLALVKNEIALARLEVRLGARKIGLTAALALLGLHFASLMTLFVGVALLGAFLAGGLSLPWAGLATAGIFLALALVLAGLAYARLQHGEPQLVSRHEQRR